MKQVVTSNKAPQTTGLYSQAIQAGGLLFISGQLPIDPETGRLAGFDISTQTRQCFINIGSILEEANMTFNDIIKTTVYMRNLHEINEMKTAYGSFFDALPHACSMVEVSGLPRNALIEVEAVAEKSESLSISL